MSQDNEIEELKRHPNLIRVYQNYVKLRREGDKYVGICPFHQEKSGSFVVYAKDMLCHCFGCGISFNAIQCVQKLDDISFKEAVEKVKGLLGESKWEASRTLVEATFKPVAETNKTYKTFTLAQYAKYSDNLKTSKEAQDWLASRGISLETALRLNTGYRQDIAGLAGEKNKHLAAQGWICFPCVQGDTVVSIKYRSIVEKAFSKQPGMATALYNTDAIDVFEDVLLTEGEMDSLVLEQAGFRAVSLASASSHPTPDQKDLLMKASRVFLAGDVDGGVGEVIMSKLWRELEERTYMLKWPDGMKDANQTFLEKCKGDVSVFRKEVEGLIGSAASCPMPDVYSLPEVMLHGSDTSLKDRPDRLRFEWPSVDNMVILLPGSVLTLFATQTGSGKSAFAMNLTLHNAIKHSQVVLNLQCELSTAEFSTMTAAHVLKKNRNFLDRKDFTEAAKILEDVKYYIGYDPSISTVDQALDLIEAAIKRLGCDLVCIDHIHFLCRNEANEVTALSNAMQRIKRMASQFHCKFVVIGQPRKQSQQSRGRPVALADAKGSESFASDSDATMALHRDVIKSSDSDAPSKDNLESKTKVLLLKARSKGEGNAESQLLFMGEFATFSEIDYTHEEPE